ncbi:RagB/SusD family nutrient uptake outer membrane protein [Chitinophaga lutea]|uniref:RagB/SusD family nutrient uptake outer membrane protein n=1 Tax=Chitinophaga lutea TaxID=2488634 RepID=A0A3N4Q4Z5_9BACT|nr:RagB/SusD family nutrient uptake outer membrane protein [Chitinophaga lutea]RPE14309.1 RagB/SusD family nutrient uptake outer membrane protein [Chitinophaga lutea]
MNKLFRTFPRIAILAALCSVLFSCSKMLDVESNRVKPEKDNWEDIEDTRNALIGVYGLMRAALCDNATHWMQGEFRMGDFSAVARPDLKAVIGNNLNASYPLVQNLQSWRRFYAVINAANLFIERAGEVRAKDAYYSEGNYKIDIAQMRSMRAFAYFYMTRIWGDVPLLVSSFDGQFPQLRRTSQDTVLAFAERELVEAAKDLPYIYSGADPQLPNFYYSESMGRWSGTLFNKVSAYAVLAHIAAWQERYADVIAYTRFIIDNYPKASIRFTPTTVELTRASDGFFARRTPTQILNFTFDYMSQEGTTTGHIEEYTLAKPFISKTVPEVYVPKDSIVKIFNQPGDERFSIDPGTGYPLRDYYFSSYNQNIPVFSKIKVIENGASSGTFRLFTGTLSFTRMEELALLRAEAAVMTGDRGEAELWLANVMKSRGIVNPAFTGKDLIEEIFAERRRELMGEAWRFYDRIRYQRIKKDDPAFLKLIGEGGIYWPVAADVLSQNSLLTQNSYWLK